MSAGYQRLVELLADTAQGVAGVPAAQVRQTATGVAGRLFAERRRRAQWFGPRLFWEPSWDILLYLYGALESGEDQVPIDQFTDLDVAVSPDSIARWIALLRDQDLIVTRPHEGVACLALTANGVRGMSGYLASIAPRPARMESPRVS